MLFGEIDLDLRSWSVVITPSTGDLMFLDWYWCSLWWLLFYLWLNIAALEGKCASVRIFFVCMCEIYFVFQIVWLNGIFYLCLELLYNLFLQMFQKDHHAIDILLAEIDIYELFAFKHCKGRRVKLALCEGSKSASCSC